MSITVVLPGKILSTKGCKKNPQNEKEISFRFSGESISLTGVKDLFGMKDGVSATFQIPKDCKLRFETRKPKKKAAEKKEDEAEKGKKKKGGLGIGDGDKGKDK